MLEDKVFFTPGDIVTIRQDLENKPEMIVIKKETLLIKIKNSTDKEDYFRGIRCRWFTTDKLLQEAVFSTKDLKLINKNKL